MKHYLFHRKVRVIGCAACQTEVDAIWKARADRGWTTDPSDPGWRQCDAEAAARILATPGTLPPGQSARQTP